MSRTLPRSACGEPPPNRPGPLTVPLGAGDRLRRHAEVRNSSCYWALTHFNRTLAGLTGIQLTQLMCGFERRELEQGEVVWKAKSPAVVAVVVTEGAKE